MMDFKKPFKDPADPATRKWRAEVLRLLQELNSKADRIIARRWRATRFGVDIRSEPVSDTALKARRRLAAFTTEGDAMPTQTGTIAPNSRAVMAVVPQAADGTPTALEGNLRAIFVEPAVFTVDSTDPLSIVVKVEPPADLNAQPQTHCTIDDDADSDPTLEITFDWQKAIVTVKATQFGVTITSEPLA